MSSFVVAAQDVVDKQAGQLNIENMYTLVVAFAPEVAHTCERVDHGLEMKRLMLASLIEAYDTQVVERFVAACGQQPWYWEGLYLPRGSALVWMGRRCSGNSRLLEEDDRWVQVEESRASDESVRCGWRSVERGMVLDGSFDVENRGGIAGCSWVGVVVVVVSSYVEVIEDDAVDT